jgi:GNAT superfamily N-acetyltransferase
LIDNYDEYKHSALNGMNDPRYSWNDIAANYREVFRQAICANGDTHLRSLPGLTFCEIEAAHYQSLSSFLKENDVPAIVRTFNPFPMNDDTARRISLSSRRDHYYGAFLEGRMVGLSMLRGWDEGYAVPSFGILVDHRFHNKGIGSRLTDFTIAEADDLCCERVRLSVFASNPAAIRVYAAKGFVESHREAVLLAGFPDEKIIMFRELR